MNTENTVKEINTTTEHNALTSPIQTEGVSPATESYTTESTLFAEPIAHFGSFTVTNSLFTSWIVVFIIIVIAIVVRLKVKKIPKGIQNIFEIIIEGAESLCDQITNSRAITNKAFPIVFTIFINWTSEEITYISKKFVIIFIKPLVIIL